MRSTPAEPEPDPELTRALAGAMPGGRLAGPLRAYRSVDSTQTVARRWGERGAPEGAVVLAAHQSAGRGRRGRTWTAPPGAGLLVSIVLRPPLPVPRWPEVGIAAGCAVAEAVEATTGLPVQLKWPNDVLAGARKLAGILAEGCAGADGLVILGIGVNVSQAARDWPPELAGRAVSLAMLGRPVGLADLLGAVLAALERWYGTLLRGGFAPVRDAWRTRAVLGQVVATARGPGTAVDLAADGGLVIRYPDGATAVVTTGTPLEPAGSPVA
jgi:BirA family biotin operon repressor/biotin-[acetyl-CoA-carboxylase] ligase